MLQNFVRRYALFLQARPVTIIFRLKLNLYYVYIICCICITVYCIDLLKDNLKPVTAPLTKDGKLSDKGDSTNDSEVITKDKTAESKIYQPENIVDSSLL